MFGRTYLYFGSGAQTYLLHQMMYQDVLADLVHMARWETSHHLRTAAKESLVLMVSAANSS